MRTCRSNWRVLSLLLLALAWLAGVGPSPGWSQTVGDPHEDGPGDPNPDPNPDPDGPDEPDPDPDEADAIAPTPVQAAIDGYADAYAQTGAFDFGGVPVEIPADQIGAGPLTEAEALAVLDTIYAHRLDGEGDDVAALLARDPEVAAARAELLATGRLTTTAADPAAVLHHLNLLRNAGAPGGATLAGGQVVSIGIRPLPLPPSCRINLGGFVQWANGRGLTCNVKDEATVFLTVRQANGQVYRATTVTRSCGPPDRSVFGFRQVPAGAAEVIARPTRLCCQEGRTSFQITCPPGPSMLLPCVPPGTQQLASVVMGPWNPPGFSGRVVGQGAAGARVWIANYENACLNSGQAVADAQGFFGVRGCLPSGDVYVYAEGGGQMGRVNVSDQLACGTGEAPLLISLLPLPRIQGQIRNWQPSWYQQAGALARGCSLQGCNGGGSTIVESFASITGTYQLVLKPGRWLLSSFRDFGFCTNANQQQVRWRCERIHGYLDLQPGEVRTIDLDPVLNLCTCPL